MVEIKIKEVKLYKGLMLRSNPMTIWWDNTKHGNDPSNRIEAVVDLELLNENSKKEYLRWKDTNYDYDTFFSIIVDEQNRLLDFKRDKDFENLIHIKRRLGVRGTKVFELE
jgi:hypothetical protein